MHDLFVEVNLSGLRLAAQTIYWFWFDGETNLCSPGHRRARQSQGKSGRADVRQTTPTRLHTLPPCQTNHHTDNPQICSDACTQNTLGSICSCRGEFEDFIRGVDNRHYNPSLLSALSTGVGDHASPRFFHRMCQSDLAFPGYLRFFW